MRNILFLLSCLMAYGASAQVSTSPSDYSSSRRMIPMGKLGPAGNTETEEDLQAKFFKQEWSPGIVYFKNSTQTMQVPLIFDVYGNKLYFLQDKQIMEFMQAVSEFSISCIKKGDSTVARFRSFYPTIEKNTEETFYEVLADGKFQLLKCKAKTIYLHKEQNLPDEERILNKELFYAFVPGDKIVLIKKDKDFILSQLPEHAATIQSIITSNKLKLKNEESLKKLFQLLNQNQ